MCVCVCVYTYIILFIYFLAALGLCCWVGFSPVVVHWFLIVVASFVSDPEFQGTRTSVAATPRLYGTGSITVVHGFSCSTVCRIFFYQGLNLCLFRWQADSLSSEPPGKFTRCIIYAVVCCIASMVRIWTQQLFPFKKCQYLHCRLCQEFELNK